ncbi:Putative pectinesterase/pectinesterase inhibitor 28 [Linum grandiflorum]
MGKDEKEKKKIAIIGVSSLLLVAMVIAVTIGVNQEKGGHGSRNTSNENADEDISTSSKFVTALCEPSTYKESCKKSVSKAAENNTDPKKIVQAGFEMAAESLRESLKKSSTVKEITTDPLAKRGVEICEELLETAIEDLKRSVDELGSFEPSKAYAHIDNLKTWLEATITFQENCKDGFENTTGPAGEKMREILKYSGELTSNGLAMVAGLAKIFETLHIGSSGNRRLLVEDQDDDGLPLWLNQGQRKLLGANPDNVRADMVVAKDGSGQYKSIMKAINAIPKKHKIPFVIKVKAGVYKEQVLIPKKAAGVVMIGDGPTKTRVTGSKNFADGVQTSDTATFAVVAPGFIAKNMGFENSAGAEGHQAVAFRSRSDNSVLYNCAFDGYQDTLYTQAYRQFFRDCTITGTIDFVFGAGRTILQNCKLIVRKPLSNQHCILTAEGKKDRNGDSAIVLQNCHVSSSPEYFPVRRTNKAYLGRPWKEYSTTIIMNSKLDDLIAPEGWSPWIGDFGLNTLFYAEYQNKGAGAAQDKRVKWKGIKKLNAAQAQKFTPAKLYVEGDAWIKDAGIPYTAGF